MPRPFLEFCRLALLVGIVFLLVPNKSSASEKDIFRLRLTEIRASVVNGISRDPRWPSATLSPSLLDNAVSRPEWIDSEFHRLFLEGIQYIEPGQDRVIRFLTLAMQTPVLFRIAEQSEHDIPTLERAATDLVTSQLKEGPVKKMVELRLRERRIIAEPNPSDLRIYPSPSSPLSNEDQLIVTLLVDGTHRFSFPAGEVQKLRKLPETQIQESTDNEERVLVSRVRPSTEGNRALWNKLSRPTQRLITPYFLPYGKRRGFSSITPIHDFELRDALMNQEPNAKRRLLTLYTAALRIYLSSYFIFSRTSVTRAEKDIQMAQGFHPTRAWVHHIDELIAFIVQESETFQIELQDRLNSIPIPQVGGPFDHEFLWGLRLKALQQIQTYLRTVTSNS